MSEKRYCLLRDNDGHSFVVEAERKDDFYKWVKLQESDDEDAVGWLEPEYARPVEGDLTFERPLIFGADPYKKLSAS
jgi:hypothetical protein